MATVSISSIRAILRNVNGYKRDSSAPFIVKDSRSGRYHIHFHKLGQVRLAYRCAKSLRASGLTVFISYPDLIVEPY